MKITFNGHSATERETELTQEELAILFEVMVRKFRDHIEFGRFDSAYPSYAEKNSQTFATIIVLM